MGYFSWLVSCRLIQLNLGVGWGREKNVLWLWRQAHATAVPVRYRDEGKYFLPYGLLRLRSRSVRGAFHHPFFMGDCLWVK